MAMIDENKRVKIIFAKVLKQLLISLVMSQKEFAAILEVPPTTVNAWVTGRALPRPELIEKINNYFKIDIRTEVNKRMATQNKNNVVDLRTLLLAGNIVYGGKELDETTQKKMVKILDAIILD
jgi:transcriptional regulator with XRE-family HTH domain